MEAILKILGCGSAAPSIHRANTAQILEIANKNVLIDCGEGTQLQLMKFNISAFKIDIIVISHLHGDHYLGLPGLLNTLSLYNRTKPLKIFGPKGIKKLLTDYFKLTKSRSNFEILITEINPKSKKKILDDKGFKIFAFPLKHRIPCFGFHFSYFFESININKQKCDIAQLGIEAYKHFKNKNDFESNGRIYLFKDFTKTHKKQISYSFITDSLFIPELAPFIYKTDLLYHDSTYLNTLLDKAISNYHSTALQAAEMALLSKAKQLILGHFSSRYINTDDLLTEAKSINPNSDLAEDGKIFIIK